MTTPSQLQLHHPKVGDFPAFTFGFEIRLLEMSMTLLHELWVLVEAIGTGHRYLVDAEKAWTTEPIPLGTDLLALSGDLVPAIHNDRLWQTELGILDWVFCAGLRGRQEHRHGAGEPLNYPVDGVAYMLVYEDSVELVPGGTHKYVAPVAYAVLLHDSCFVIAGEALYRNSEMPFVDGLAHVNGLFVRGDDVFVSLAGEPFIIQQNASRHHRCPQATRLCAKVSDQGDAEEALEQERGNLRVQGAAAQLLSSSIEDYCNDVIALAIKLMSYKKRRTLTVENIKFASTIKQNNATGSCAGLEVLCSASPTKTSTSGDLRTSSPE